MSAKIIAVANQKGGVGKTTTALSLAAALARADKSVLIMDLDPHVCASVHLRFYPEEQPCTIHALFASEAEAWPALWSSLILHQEGQFWDMVSGDVRLAEIEGDVRGRPNKGFILSEALKSVPDTYDFIILDCPPQMGVLLVNALVASDLLVIPIQTDFLALHGLKLLFDTLRTLNKALPKPIRYRTLPTMYDK
ncbi:MAG: AAA family ATPase, partial [Bilophila sp.]